MFYNGADEKYLNDCRRLTKVIDKLSEESRAIGTVIHFHYYDNPKRPADRVLQEFAGKLPSNEYWSEFRIIPDEEPPQHFVRLAFGRK